MDTVQISFKEATNIAKENLVELVENVTDITVEGIEHAANYEVKLSYTIDSNLNTDNSGLGSLAKIMGRRRDMKLFKISDQGDFLGFNDAQKSNS